jgi:hypothetical protein
MDKAFAGFGVPAVTAVPMRTLNAEAAENCRACRADHHSTAAHSIDLRLFTISAVPA